MSPLIKKNRRLLIPIDQMITQGIDGVIKDSKGVSGTMREKALACIDEMKAMVKLLMPHKESLRFL